MNLASLLLIESGRDLNARPPNSVTRARLLSINGFSGKGCVLEPMRVWDIAKTAKDEADVWSALHIRYVAE
jgi:hypothetical protein